MTKASRPELSRREFLRLCAAMGVAGAISVFLEACSQAGLSTPTSANTQLILPYTPTTSLVSPSPTLTQPVSAGKTPAPALENTPMGQASSTPAGEISQVAFVKTTNRAQGVLQALDLLGINPVSGKRVLLKPNLNSADPTPGSTHPDVLRALVLALQDMGASKVTIGDRSGMGVTAKVMQRLGVVDLSRELGCDLVSFEDLPPEDWVMITPHDSHWQHGFPFARPCLEADALVQTCCLKTHQYGGHFTMSLKNSVGMVGASLPVVGTNFMDELHSSAYQRLMIAEINSAYAPALIVLDGVEAFTDRGPATGRLVSSQVMLAGTDRVAIDAVGVALLRYYGTTQAVASGSIFDQQQIARAVELGLGVDNPHKIQLLTADPQSEAYAQEIREILNSES